MLAILTCAALSTALGWHGLLHAPAGGSLEAWVFGAAVVLGLLQGLGALLIALGRGCAGARLAFAAALPLVPLGLLGLLGARRVLDEAALHTFQRRR